MKREFRRAARLVIVDQINSVLLFQYEDGGRRWWATPGGGLEENETFEEAAAREAREELSLTDLSLTPLWSRTVDFSFNGRPVRQFEHYFLFRLQHDQRFRTSVGETHRREKIVAIRWWSAEELKRTSEQVFPEDLHERLGALLSAGPPANAS